MDATRLHRRTRRNAATAAAAAAAALLLAGCASAGPGAGASGEASPSPSATAATAGPLDVSTAEAECAADGDTVLGRGDDGTALALVYGTGPAVVIANQVNETLCGMDSYGRDLAASGYRVALVDANDPKPDELIVETAQWLEANGSDKVGLLGASRGATYVLAAAPKAASAATVALSPPKSFRGVDAEAAMADITTPTLIVAGGADGQFAADAEALQAAQPAADVVIVADSREHGHDFIDVGSAVRDQVLAFLKDNLGS